MSEVKVNKISPRTNCGTVTLGDSGDTFTIPSGATITNAGTASGFGATGETSWDTTVKTTGTFTAVAGLGYFLNTTGGIITVNLPAGAAGSSVAMADYAATWQTNNVTVSPNGSEKIGGINADVTLSTEGQSVTLVYIDSTQGWVNVIDSTSNVRAVDQIVATGGTPCTGAICGDYKIHTFTGPGTFCVSGISSTPGCNVVDYLVVAGGAAGGGSNPGGSCAAGGAGAGGYRESVPSPAAWTASPIANPGNARPVSVQGYPIVVGGGGVGAGASVGASGSTSTFSDISSTGGGGGANGPGGCGAAGGSGGGGGTSGGAGNTPPFSPAQGFCGGAGSGAGQTHGGGGGGATVAGVAGNPTDGGAGGAGGTTCISATPTIYGGGGGGASGYGTGALQPCASRGAAGPGGGGQGANCGVGCAATVNTGGGGGGASGYPGGNHAGGGGGSGVVVLRYKFQ